ncbi:Rrf2 family transcriptional regulator [Novacetimonas hansenii]|uniref:RrF2 family transcriptional regulator n=2 Tax=Novacetimonas hansenii TaxID=436 RepID=UPI00094FFFE0|nr:Rrf2 family transcriptional regulator [Novacetimonas hansenii]MBL7236174.1 Rrf2 family transcriptional regulator [Novacetimonas hansenii]PYD73211.1 Rrf2 family transcriptional regulator [Novacetimonas hansenii]QOF94314.1 Rrf2 family transcriptional regulator [Novacetimonas hansenii]
MRMTLHTDYALRTLFYVGLHTDRRVSIREVANAYGISENHLVKVIHKLGRGGFIQTMRGRGGGLTLARAADEIRIGDVVRYTEEDMNLVACEPTTVDGRSCVLARHCRLRGLLGQAIDAFMMVLDGATLGSLLTDEDCVVLRQIFAITQVVDTEKPDHIAQ